MNQEEKQENSGAETQGDLWQAARDMNKFNFVAGLEGKAKSLWISSIILIILAIVLYFVIPGPGPTITHVELFESQNITAIATPDNVFLIDTTNYETTKTLNFDLEQIDGINLSKKELTLYDLKNHKKEIIQLRGDKNSEVSEMKLNKTVTFKNSNDYNFFFSWEGISIIPEGEIMYSISDVSEIRFFSSMTITDDNIWVADYDRLLHKNGVDSNWKSITLREDKPIKHITTLENDLCIIYEDGKYLRIDDGGNILEQKNLSSWTGFGHGKISDVEGNTVVSANGYVVQIGTITDSKPEKTINLKEVIIK
jgi:hypothetical protein